MNKYALHALLFFSLAIGLSLPQLSSAEQHLPVHPLYLEQHEPSDYYFSTLRTHDGYLWIGSDIGLIRYNGTEFKRFKFEPENPSSIGSLESYRLLETRDKKLLIGGSSLSLYHPETETFTRYDITSYSPIYAMHEDDNGHLWLAGLQLGIVQFDPVKGEVVNRFFDEPGNAATVFLVEASKHNKGLWLATNKGLALFDPKNNTLTHHFQVNDNKALWSINGIAEDDEGNVWLSTFREGLYIYNPNTQKARHLDQKDGLGTQELTRMDMDSKGNLWIATEKQGLYHYNMAEQKFSFLRASDNDPFHIPVAAVVDIKEDYEGNIWMSAGKKGIFRISPDIEKFQNLQYSFDSVESLIHNNLAVIYADSRGAIWIGTDGGGLDRYDPSTQSFTHYKHDPKNSNSLGADTVLDIAEDQNGYLWLGTWAGGLNRLDPNTGDILRITRDSHAAPEKMLREDNIYRVVVHDDGRILIAVGYSGLQIYDPKTQTFVTHTANESLQNTLHTRIINDIERADEHHYWVAGHKGIEKFNITTGEWSHPPVAIFEAIWDIYRTNDGWLWLATGGGLIRFNPANNEVIRYTTDDGLPENYILGIEQDALGDLWLATRKGIARFSPNTKRVETFNQADGLASMQHSRLAHELTRDGMLLFGGQSGLSIFDPLHMPYNEYAPKLHWQELFINQTLQYPESSEWLSHVLDYMPTLTLPYSARDIQIGFVGTNLISPAENKYHYRLLGQHNDWRDASTKQRLISLNNLAPGNYELQLLGRNNDGVWTGAPKTLGITILPPWWRTWWAYALYAVCWVGMLYLFSLWRLQKSLQQKQQLEALVAEQTHKLKSANSAISQLNTELEQRVNQRTEELSKEIDERKESEAKAHYIAYHDSLTSLYNRSWLLKHLADHFKDRDIHQKPFALLFIGGDRFRKINDTYGHRIGDLLLLATAERLTQLCPNQGRLARLGSDEFALFLESTHHGQVERLAANIVNAFSDKICIERLQLNFSVSVGYVLAGLNYTEPAQVLRNANIAMQGAKERGRGQYQAFDEQMLQAALEKVALEDDLKQAVIGQQFSLAFQPIVNIDNTRIRGFEALIRWIHSERGFVPPDKFIPLAESNGLINEIGLWVFEQSCIQQQQWHSLNPEIKPIMSVNLSPVQLESADFLPCIKRILENTGADPRYIKFEITETALLRYTEAVDNILDALRELGIVLAIDDFGTGYSSLAYLDKLPVQVLKIDRSFTNGLCGGDNQCGGGASEIVKATIALAHNLNMQVVAEGIETEEQLKLLESYGCDYGQGYFIARPMPAADATTFLQEHKNNK